MYRTYLKLLVCVLNNDSTYHVRNFYVPKYSFTILPSERDFGELPKVDDPRVYPDHDLRILPVLNLVLVGSESTDKERVDVFLVDETNLWA